MPDLNALYACHVLSCICMCWMWLNEQAVKVAAPITAISSTTDFHDPFPKVWRKLMNKSNLFGSELQIRHSKSDPLINSSTNGYKYLIEKSDCEDTTDSALLLPHWFSSSSSLSSMDSTISAEDLIHEMVTIEGLRTLYASCFVLVSNQTLIAICQTIIKCSVIWLQMWSELASKSRHSRLSGMRWLCDVETLSWMWRQMRLSMAKKSYCSTTTPNITLD